MKIPALLVMSLGLAACGGASSDAAPASAPSTALRRAVAFDLPTADGALVAIPIANHTTVIDAWSPSCVPCREAVPALAKRAAELEGANAKLVLVAVLADGETTEQARATLTSWGVTRPFLVDRGEVLRREASIDGLPATLVISPKGEVMWVAPANASTDDIIHAARMP